MHHCIRMHPSTVDYERDTRSAKVTGKLVFSIQCFLIYYIFISKETHFGKFKKFQKFYKIEELEYIEDQKRALTDVTRLAVISLCIIVFECIRLQWIMNVGVDFACTQQRLQIANIFDMYWCENIFHFLSGERQYLTFNL
ncbi:hypothetical protein WUBG_17812 [Wuchereria bancrofti]|uniref:Uncharacterized protein n=1 Tax=Wuchereria bancrofti TaxID=6293 RepID=J9E2V1_WUCBA|nr:hypothetical protein WUBG_17812 [Wuchereria bancrofti]